MAIPVSALAVTNSHAVLTHRIMMGVMMLPTCKLLASLLEVIKKDLLRRPALGRSNPFIMCKTAYDLKQRVYLDILVLKPHLSAKSYAGTKTSR